MPRRLPQPSDARRVISEIAAHLARWIMAATRIRRGSGNAGARKQFRLESDRERSIGRRRQPGSDRRDGRSVQAPLPMQTYHIRLDQFEQGNAARGHAGEVEAAPCRAMEAMTSRRFPAPWRADKIPGGYVVRDVNVHLFPRQRSRSAAGQGADERRGAADRRQCHAAAGAAGESRS
jgi:hypothetical protein